MRATCCTMAGIDCLGRSERQSLPSHQGDCAMLRRDVLLGGFALTLPATAARAQGAVPPSDLLLATLWNQRSVEYKGNALTAYTLARLRLDQALADQKWTGAPAEQKGNFADLPPAVVVDIDETV